MDTVMTKFTTRGAHDKSLSSEEPCDGKLSRTVRERRRGSRGSRRPQLVDIM